MPTVSQFKILSKLGCEGNVQTTLGPDGAEVSTRVTSARALLVQQATEAENEPVYVPPLVARVFTDLKKDADLRRARAMEGGKLGGKGTFFPDMVSMASTLSQDTAQSELSADEIMKRLHELGWRKEGDGQRFAEEKRKREEDKKRQEEDEARKKREALDLVNDPLLRRVKERNQAIPKQIRAPDPRPFAVCFDVRGPSVAHSTVKMKIDQLLEELGDTDIKMTTIEYQPRAMHIKGDNVGNRWVITLDSLYGVASLDGLKLYFGKEDVLLRRYDDVMTCEFDAFTRQTNFKKKMFTSSAE